MKRVSYIIASVVVVSGNFLADRVAKFIALHTLSGGKVLSFLGNAVVISLAQNDGAFLSLGSGWPPALKYPLLLALPIGVCLYGIYYAAFKETDLTKSVLISTIVGGGLGNLVDRLFNNFHVVDFLNFGIGSLRTGVLNVADLSVTFGAIALLAYEFKAESKRKNRRV